MTQGLQRLVVNGLRVEVQQSGSLHEGARTVVRAGWELGLPSTVQAGPEGLFASRRDVKTGDPELDVLVRLDGDPAHILARLGEGGRAALQQLVMAMGDRIADGLLVHSEMGWIDGGRLPRLMNRLTGVVQALTVPDVATGLADNVCADPVRELRLRCGALLAARFPGSPAAARAGAALVDMYDSDLRLLGELLRAEDAPPSVDRLTWLRDEVPLEVAGWALRGLAGFGGGAIEPLLAFVDDEETELRVAALETVGAVGELSTVEALLPHTRGLFTSGRVKDAARAAVVAIQERSGLADAGRLSIATDASAATGGVTVSEEPDGGVSLS